MQHLKSKPELSKSKRMIKPIKRTIEPIKSQRTAAIRTHKSLLESLQFIKEELLIQLPNTSFAIVFYLTQELTYTSSTIKLDSSARLSLPQINSMRARIQKRLQDMVQPQSQQTTQTARDRYCSQEQHLYQAFTLTWYTSRSSMIRTSTETTKRTLSSITTMRRTPTVNTTIVRSLLNTMSQKETHQRPHLQLKSQ